MHMIKFIQYVVDTNVLINFILSELVDLSEEEKYLIDTYDKTSSSSLLIPYFILTELQVTLTRGILKKYGFAKDDVAQITKEFKEFIRSINKYGTIMKVEDSC